MKTIHNLLKRQFQSSPTNIKYPNLTSMQRWIIGYLYEHNDEDVFQRDLEEAFSIRRSTATGILQLMEKNNLIVRKPVPHDARLKKLVLTNKAIEIQKMITEEIKDHEKRICKNISQEELDLFLDVLKKIRKNLEE